MDRLHCDMGNYDSVVAAVYEAGTSPDLWRAALQRIAELFDDVGALLMFQRDDGSYGTIVSASLDVAQRDYEAMWWRHDVRASRAIERGLTLQRWVMTDKDVVTEEEMDTLPIYTQFSKDHGLGRFAAALLLPTPQRFVWCTVHRKKSKGPFSEKEIGTLERLAAHLENSLRLGIRLLNSEKAADGLCHFLSRLDVALFLIDDAGRVIFSNDKARELVTSGFLLKRAIGKVEPQLVPSRVDTRPVVYRSDNGDAYTIYRIPVVTDINLFGGRTIVAAFDRRRREVDPAAVRDILGLTLGEARVASLVGAGMRPKQAASKLGVTEATVRTTLKAVFSKSGTRGQSELAALLSRAALSK